MSALKEKPSLKQLIIKTIATAQQEMLMTLPSRLLLAFNAKEHEKSIDPDTNKPFTSFYRWLWVPPPPGVGLCGSEYMDADDIIHMLEKTRDRCPEGERGPLIALIEEMKGGHGAAKKRGGSRPYVNKSDVSEQSDRTVGLNGEPSRTIGNRSSSLAGRMSDSKDPKVKEAWQAHVEGKCTVHAAAVACGMRSDSNNPLVRLKQYWKRASKADRREFLKWLETAEAKP